MHRLLFCSLVVMSLSCTGCSQSTSPDRIAAEWVLATGGSVGIEGQGKQRQISADMGLPSGEFHVYSIAWDIYPGDRNTQVTDNDLARISALTELRDLDLWAADISDKGMSALVPLTNLRRLQLSQTHVTDAALDQLKPLTKLAELGLIGTSVSSASIKRFQRDHPECRVVTSEK